MNEPHIIIEGWFNAMAIPSARGGQGNGHRARVPVIVGGPAMRFAVNLQRTRKFGLKELTV